MSKAFTREENQGPDIPDLPARESALPFGATNYVTREGADRLRNELARLATEERPRLTAIADDMDVKRRLARVDQRIAQIEESLDSAQVITHTAGAAERVTFGATVTVRENGGATAIYRIVGVDETDFDAGCISWVSPIARALMNHRAGERIVFAAPDGDIELVIESINY